MPQPDKILRAQRPVASAPSEGITASTPEPDEPTGVMPPAVDTTGVAKAPLVSLPVPTSDKKKYRASIMTDPGPHLPPKFVHLVRELEGTLKMPIWLLAQGDSSLIDDALVDAFYRNKPALEPNKRIALLVDSLGGYGKCAYQIAYFLQQHCGGFVAVVPNWAKSAATLLTLGAESIVLAKSAELGPLDAQLIEGRRLRSALDEVQSAERLQTVALEAVNQAMGTWPESSKRSIEFLLPIACHFAADLMRPCFEKIDTIQLTERSRIVKEAEEYAVRLLDPGYSPLSADKPASQRARRIAKALVEKYPVHDFAIGAAEALGLGLPIVAPTANQERILDQLLPFFYPEASMVAIGHLEEVPK